MNNKVLRGYHRIFMCIRNSPYANYQLNIYKHRWHKVWFWCMEKEIFF